MWTLHYSLRIRKSEQPATSKPPILQYISAFPLKASLRTKSNWAEKRQSTGSEVKPGRWAWKEFHPRATASALSLRKSFVSSHCPDFQSIDLREAGVSISDPTLCCCLEQFLQRGWRERGRFWKRTRTLKVGGSGQGGLTSNTGGVFDCWGRGGGEVCSGRTWSKSRSTIDQSNKKWEGSIVKESQNQHRTEEEPQTLRLLSRPLHILLINRVICALKSALIPHIPGQCFWWPLKQLKI